MQILEAKHLYEQFIQEDCLKVLARVPDCSVDLAFYDPPYFEIVNEQWDNQWKNEDEYIDWCFKWMNETVRILKPSGSLYVCGTTKTNTFLKFKLMVDKFFPDLTYQNEIVWVYNWGGRRKDHFARKHENIWVWSKGPKAVFYADDVRVPYTIKKSPNPDYELNPLGTIPVSWWQMQIVKGSKEKQDHPTQKPEAMLERIIKAHTKPGDLVIDVFGGSFTTAIVAERLERRWISCDISKEYCEMGKKRLEDNVQKAIQQVPIPTV